jgi:uncharacterized protein
MQLLETTHKHLSSFANYCRTGKLENIPGIKKDNITEYRRLVYNVIDDTLQSAYPLTHDLLTKKEWDATVNDFLTNHPCQSPQVWYMPKEFYLYVAGTNNSLLKKYPFLEELLSFEWMETELFMMDDIKVNVNNNGSVVSDRLVINPEHRLVSFAYPVHNKKAKDITDTDKRNYFVVGHRDIEGNVIFSDLAPALVRMLEYLNEKPSSLKELIQQLQSEFSIALTEADQQMITSFFENAYQQKLIIGFQN